jgi:DNA-binding NtrC family response regulator
MRRSTTIEIQPVMRGEVDDYLDELQDDHLGLVGSASATVTLRDLIRQVATSPRPVLIAGPSGSGKSVVAQAIHRLRWSTRGPAVAASPGQAPLIQVSCAALSTDELEKLLFGTAAEPGVLASSAGGTLVLDDVDRLPLEIQAELSDVLQRGKLPAARTAAAPSITVRVVAVTSRSLRRCVRERTFREDLLYELNVLAVPVPGLDEHREDIPALVNHFLRLRQSKLRFSPEALAVLGGRSWPGGVRELKNVVDRAVALGGGPIVGPEAVRALVAPEPLEGAIEDSLRTLVGRLLDLPVGNKLAAVEAALLEQAMRAAAGNKTAAGRLLGLHRKAVERKLEKYRSLRWIDEIDERSIRESQIPKPRPLSVVRMSG